MVLAGPKDGLRNCKLQIYWYLQSICNLAVAPCGIPVARAVCIHQRSRDGVSRPLHDFSLPILIISSSRARRDGYVRQYEGPSKSEIRCPSGKLIRLSRGMLPQRMHHQGRRYTVASPPASAGHEHIAHLLPLSYVKLARAAPPLRTSRGRGPRKSPAAPRRSGLSGRAAAALLSPPRVRLALFDPDGLRERIGARLLVLGKWLVARHGRGRVFLGKATPRVEEGGDEPCALPRVRGLRVRGLRGMAAQEGHAALAQRRLVRHEAL